MDKNFNFSVWSFSSIVAGFLFGGVMALAEGANLWPLTAILGGITGLIIGIIIGVIFKLINMPMKYAWCVFGLLVFLAFCFHIYTKYYYTSDYGKLIEANIIKCETSAYFFTPPYRKMNERREINGIDLTLNVARERKLGKFEDQRIEVYEWNIVDYTKTYFMQETSCETMISGKAIVMRAMDYGLDYEYVHRINWNTNNISQDGRFIIDR
jgi:hypothetical protein